MARKKATAKPRPEPEMYTIYAEILQETEATDGHEGAILVNCGDVKAVWLPVSQIRFDGERGDTNVAIELPDWLAEESGLVDGQGRAVDSGEDQTIPILAENESGSVGGQSEDGLLKPDSEQPETFTFKADVEHVYADKYVLLVTNEQDGTASLEFGKDEVTYEGQDVAELEEGYKDMVFTVSYALAVEKHLPEFLGVTAMALTEPANANAEAPAQGKIVPETSPFKNFLRKDTIEAVVKLSDEEQIAYGKAMAEALKERADNKKTASFYSTKAKNAEDEAYRIMEILEDGEEQRRIHCDVVADYNAGQLVYVESEWPHRKVQRRPMTEKDRQLTLPLDAAAAPAPADTPEEAPAAELGTVTLHGRVLHIDMDDIVIAFTDHEGEEMEFELPRTEVSYEGDLQPDDYADFTMSLSLALDEGIVDPPEAPDSEPEAESDELPNHVPAAQEPQAEGTVQ